MDAMLLQLQSKLVLAKPLEPQCSRITVVSPAWGSNSLRISRFGAALVKEIELPTSN